MNNVHDMGGLQNFGAIDTDPDAPLFHHAWERDVLVLALAMGATGTWNLDESRFARESLPPETYLSVGYYRIWFYALERLLLKHALVTQDELSQGRSLETACQVKRVLRADDVPAALASGSPVERESAERPRFGVGDLVRVQNRHSKTHTRLPAYIRGRTGKVFRVHGCHVYPDSNAVGQGEDPRWLYNIQFDAQELWSIWRSLAGRGICHDTCAL